MIEEIRENVCSFSPFSTPWSIWFKYNSIVLNDSMYRMLDMSEVLYMRLLIC